MTDPMVLVPEINFGTVLFDMDDGKVLGYELTGASAGPTILVAGLSRVRERKRCLHAG